MTHNSLVVVPGDLLCMLLSTSLSQAHCRKHIFAQHAGRTHLLSLVLVLGRVPPGPCAPYLAKRLGTVSPQGLRRGHWSQVRYRGDPLRRPIASYELAPLARLAVRASEAANRRLRLGEPLADDEPAADGILQARQGPHLRPDSFVVAP